MFAIKISDILKRANSIQKRLKGKSKVTGPDEAMLVSSVAFGNSNELTSPLLQIAVCEMELSKRGIFTRSKSFVEVDAYKRDSYETIAKRAAKKCQLSYTKGKILSLFKINGARILNEAITLNGKLKPWTMGCYMQLLKKSAGNIKLGVGYIIPEEIIVEDDVVEDDQV